MKNTNKLPLNEGTLNDDPLIKDRRKAITRPAMKIYRPPGVRNYNGINGSEKVISSSISKQPVRNEETSDKFTEEITISKKFSLKMNDKKSLDLPKTTSPGGKSENTEISDHNIDKNETELPKKAQICDESFKNQTKFAISYNGINEKKKLGTKQIGDLKEMFKKLNFSGNEKLIEQFVQSNFELDDVAQTMASILVQYAIEVVSSDCKLVSKICFLLLECPSGNQFHKGLITAVWHYFEFRVKLRESHFKFWLAYLNLISDLYSSVGFKYEGELVDILFLTYDFMLKSPVVEMLQIEELEGLISSWLTIGFDLERQCPDRLVLLKVTLRDAFVNSQEPWARKMILLLMELSASGWKLPMDANEYYFQHSAVTK